MSISKVEDAYQAALKVEEKLARRQSQWTRGGSSSRGKGTIGESYVSRILKMTNNIVTMRRVEVPNKDSMVGEVIFPEEEEEEEPEEA